MVEPSQTDMPRRPQIRHRLDFLGIQSVHVAVTRPSEPPTKEEPMKGKVSAKAAAVDVLKKARKPLPTSEIVERVLKTPGVKLGGKTPAATIAAILAVENGKPDGLFRRTAPGTYTLRAGRKKR